MSDKLFVIVSDNRDSDSHGFLVQEISLFKPFWSQKEETKFLHVNCAWFATLEEATEKYPEASYYENGYRIVGEELVPNE